MIFESHPIEGNIYLAGYLLSIVLSLVFTFLLVKAVSRQSALTQFLNRLPISAGKNVSPFGGIAVIFSFLLTLWGLYFLGAVHENNSYLFIVLTLGIGMMFLLGIYDDIYHCSPRLKLAAQCFIAIILYFAGFQIERIGGFLELNQFSIVLTIFWIVGITNSINLIDGMDGLASGVVFFSCLTLVFVYLERDIITASFLAVVLAGSTLGFFFFNFPPAKIILGDTGSLPLGLLVSLITLLPLNQGNTDEIYYLIPVITLLIPITDTAFAFFRRIFKGTSPFSKDAHHFHHRLGNLGLSSTNTICLLFAIGFYFDLSAMVPVFYINLIPRFIPIYSLFILLNVAGLIWLLRHYEKEHHHDRS
ncbi:MAG: undecaprenyl-phosphate alpha-N-acetylglucosaminyl 1-phosphate transferase [Nitrospinaceae bacterium]|nr:MAG: undecaprenyl-phosphate alpha-N-acetylglucosaminyl 1-phosphate transferase [Nitrospinaceae bacterium]